MVAACANKFEKLDHPFVPEVVGIGKRILWGRLKWQRALFYEKGNPPLCMKVHQNLKRSKIVCLLAWEASAGDDALTISPFVKTDKTRGAFQLCSRNLIEQSE